MDLVGVAELLGAAGGGAVVLGVVDRVRYRGRPRLDVADLAQRVAAETLQHARTEIDRAWAVADRYQEQTRRYEQQVDQLRAEVAELRRTVARVGADHDAAVRQLRERETELADARAALAAREAEVAVLHDEVSRLEGLTQHAQAAGRARTETR